MSHYGLLKDYRLRETAEDIRGTTLYGLHDEKLGKIDDVIFDHTTGNIGYVVVDTGGWLTTKKFIVPADRLRTSMKHEEDFASDLTKEQIEAFPPYSEKDLESDEKWRDYENRYRSKWEAHPVMHRKETDRNVTPTTQQLQGNPSSTQAAGLSDAMPRNRVQRDEVRAAEAAETDIGRVVPATANSVTISNSAVGIGGRWDTFQARLRERRKEAVVGCRTCTVGSQSVKGSESADTWKKAV
jgi:sporulation protein YlmC with PRC-barrel domain